MAVTLPDDTANAAYAPAVLAAVQAGDFTATWGTITSTYEGHTAQFRVMSDALKMDVIDSKGNLYKNVRISVSAYLEQQIADVLFCSLLTPKLADLLWKQRNVTLLPTPRVITSLTKYMIANSQAIDAQLAAQGNPTGIFQTVGKHWVIDASEDNHTGKAENYGWHFANSFGGSRWAACASDPLNAGCREIQDPGWFHDYKHLDYSQVCVLVSRVCLVDGAKTDIRAVLSDPVLAPLASHNGVVRHLRQPGVPELPSLVKDPPPVGPGTPAIISWNAGGSEFTSPDWKAVAWSAAALALVVGGFFGGLYLMGRTTRARRNPMGVGYSEHVKWEVKGNGYVGYGTVTGSKYEIRPDVLKSRDGRAKVWWKLYENDEQIDDSNNTSDLMERAETFESISLPEQQAMQDRA